MCSRTRTQGDNPMLLDSRHSLKKNDLIQVESIFPNMGFPTRFYPSSGEGRWNRRLRVWGQGMGRSCLSPTVAAGGWSKTCSKCLMRWKLCKNHPEKQPRLLCLRSTEGKNAHAPTTPQTGRKLGKNTMTDVNTEKVTANDRILQHAKRGEGEPPKQMTVQERS